MITRLSAFALSALLASGALVADSVGEPGRSAGGKNPLKNVYLGVTPRRIDFTGAAGRG
jgi:hypothetical protein